MSIGRKLSRAVSYVAVTAGVGALASLGFEDMSAVEGARQAVIAGLPLAIATGSNGTAREFDFAERHPILSPIVGAGVASTAFYLGGRAMEYLTRIELNHPFIFAAGVLGGAISGAFASIVNRFLPGIRIYLEDIEALEAMEGT
jgi:hypothetical protein